MTSFLFKFGQVDDPNPEEAALCLGLASALLRDRQYKLGAEMLGRAMNLLEPQSLHQMMNRIYSDLNDNIRGAVLGLSASSPLADKPKPSRNTFNFRTNK